MNKSLGIFGRGGFAREVKSHILKRNKNANIIFISDLVDELEPNIIHIKNIDKDNMDILTAIGDPNTREKMYNNYKNLNYLSYVHDCNNIIDEENVIIGKGSIICSGALLTTNIEIGIFNHINLNCTIGHDTTLGNFVTCSPGVNISGNCKIGSNVMIGTNTAIKENISICSNVTIGMNSNVIKNINVPGIYVGNPLRKLEKT